MDEGESCLDLISPCRASLKDEPEIKLWGRQFALRSLCGYDSEVAPTPNHSTALPRQPSPRSYAREEGLGEPNVSACLKKDKMTLFTVTAFIQALNEYPEFFFYPGVLKRLSSILISGFVHSNNPSCACNFSPQ